ncbi:DNA-binding protein [Mesorhizobium mediterraneum]|uniref:DNA-binding protein n=1 Tax=Mesorhizobium mediterraneum TaxID=43617 RepID=UPI00178287D3|nr:DNA-binding protein [Mesorhizobium mediterraneum]
MSIKMRTPAAAAYISKSPSWLNKSRMDGSGPAFMRLGGSIVYDSSDLDAWMTERRVAANDNGRQERAAA